ncbi:MAG: DUF711 family protein, partial [Chloroflexota bacterium]
MIRSDQILDTVSMIQDENLDVRTVTMGIDLLDCRSDDIDTTCANIKAKIHRYAGDLVATCEAISQKYGIPVVNKRISITPIAHVGASATEADFVKLAHALDEAAKEVGVDFVGGFSAKVENGMSKADHALINAMPEALNSTDRV